MKHEKPDAFVYRSSATSRTSSFHATHRTYPFASAKKSGVSRTLFLAAKRLFDVVLSLLLLPLVGVFALLLLFLNLFNNPGSLFFIQERMGRNCKPFRAIKFRTMKPAPSISRSADCPIEEDRITPLGRILRQSRIDELPQVINVLKGEMSLVGPRPDYYEHACHYLKVVPGYRERHSVRPGISGLAQTEVGYVQGTEATHHKVHADLHYIQHSGFRLEAWIVWRTLDVVFRRLGS